MAKAIKKEQYEKALEKQTKLSEKLAKIKKSTPKWFGVGLGVLASMAGLCLANIIMKNGSAFSFEFAFNLMPIAIALCASTVLPRTIVQNSVKKNKGIIKTYEKENGIEKPKENIETMQKNYAPLREKVSESTPKIQIKNDELKDNKQSQVK